MSGAADVTWSVAGRVATVTIDRHPVNALCTATWEAVDAAFAELARRDDASVVVLRSAVPRMFSAGADVKELPMTPDRDEARMRLTRRALDRVLGHPVPVLCAVAGPALGGGCALAAACDVRVATPSASFGLPEIDVGRCGGASHLLRHLPPGVVRLAFFTASPITAGDAHRLGFVTELVDDDGLDDRVAQLAATVAAKSPTAVRLAKQALDLAEELPVRAGYEIEQQFSLRLATTGDAAEAAAAFREKRAPVWEQ